MTLENENEEFNDALDVSTEIIVLENNEIIEIEILSEEQARGLTDTIKDAAEVLWVLIARAHSGKAWKSLGYNSWESYVRTEFDMSRSRSYQILDQARVIAAIQEAVPAGTAISISESAARDIKDYLEEALPVIKEKTEGLEPEAAAEVVKEYVEEIRNLPTPMVDEQRLEDEMLGITYDPASPEELVEAYEPAPVLKDEKKFDDVQKVEPSVTPIDDIDIRQIRRNIGFSHDITSMIAAAAGLPEDLEEVIEATTEERVRQINKNFDLAVERYNRFIELWTLKKAEYEENNEEE